MIDTEIVSHLERMRAEMGSKQTIEARAHRALVPYPLVMQTIVEEVSRPSVS